MNKGQQRMIRSAKSTVSGIVSGISQGLGFTTKSLKEMTAKEIKDLIHDIYYEPGAIEQIENTLNGRPDRRGPLSGVQKRIVASDPVIAAVVKKICIAKALSEESISTWNNLWEGAITSRSNISDVTININKLPKLVDKKIEQSIRNKRTANGFINDINSIMDSSIEESRTMVKCIDIAIDGIMDAPNLGMKQRAKSFKTIDLPTIPILEKMNGSKEHAEHALKFYAGIKGDLDFLKMPTGPYTYRELAKIFMTKDSRRCIGSLCKLQQDRDRGAVMRLPQDEEMTAEEKQYVADAKAVYDTSMAKASADHKNTLAKGQIGSLDAYHTTIEELKIAEMSANTSYSSVVTQVNFNISQRQFNERLEEQRRQAEEMQRIQEEHYRKMEEILAKYNARTAADIQRFLAEFGDELGINEALRKAEAASKGEADGESKPKEGVAVEQVVVDETAVKAAVVPDKNEGDVR